MYGVKRKAIMRQGTWVCAVAAAALLSACASKPKPSPAPQPAPIQPRAEPAPQPAAAAEWPDLPLTPGEWRYGSAAAGSEASFGLPGSEPLFVVRCDAAARRIGLSRQGLVAPARLTVRTSTGARTRTDSTAAATSTPVRTERSRTTARRRGPNHQESLRAGRLFHSVVMFSSDHS